MQTLLDAIQEGRLIELPENGKDRALQILATLIEAVPSLPHGTDVTGAVVNRERSGNTALGLGWACPHGRVPFDGELLCAIGWSPAGIDYGAPDGQPVRIVVMYLVPQNQKNVYLKEISSLVKTIRDKPDAKGLESSADLNDIRNRLLDLISATKDTEGPDTRARMIRLEARLAATPSPPPLTLAGYTMEPVTVVAGPDLKPVVLTQHRDLMEVIGSIPGLAETLNRTGSVESGPWRLLCRAATHYQADRVLFDCLAIKAVNPGPPAPPPPPAAVGPRNHSS